MAMGSAPGRAAARASRCRSVELMPILAPARPAGSAATMRSSSRKAPPPRAARNSSPVAGLRITPSTGAPSSTRAAQTVNSGFPAAKLRVPSIGSTTHTRRRASREPSSAVSSDSQPASGRSPPRVRRSRPSTAMSASVTIWPGPFSQRRCALRKKPSATSPASRTAATAPASSAASTVNGRPRSCRRSAPSAHRSRRVSPDRPPAEGPPACP